MLYGVSSGGVQEINSFKDWSYAEDPRIYPFPIKKDPLETDFQIDPDFRADHELTTTQWSEAVLNMARTALVA